MRKMAILALGLVAGCSEMVDYYPAAEVVEVEGRAFFVTPAPSGAPGLYLAGPNDPQAAEVWAGQGRALPAANVAAIEAVTGCAVLAPTVRNQEVTTLAAVAC